MIAETYAISESFRVQYIVSPSIYVLNDPTTVMSSPSLGKSPGKEYFDEGSNSTPWAQHAVASLIMHA